MPQNAAINPATGRQIQKAHSGQKLAPTHSAMKAFTGSLVASRA